VSLNTQDVETNAYHKVRNNMLSDLDPALSRWINSFYLVQLRGEGGPVHK